MASRSSRGKCLVKNIECLDDKNNYTSISELNFWILQANVEAILHDPTIPHITMLIFLRLLLFPLSSSSCPYPCPYLLHASRLKRADG